jgi:hypothetical protein
VCGDEPGVAERLRIEERELETRLPKPSKLEAGAQRTRIPEPVEASLGRGGDRVVPVDSVCPGDSVNYPGAWGFPFP